MSIESSPHVTPSEEKPVVPAQITGNGEFMPEETYEAPANDQVQDYGATSHVPLVIKIVDEEIINIGHTEVKFGTLPKHSPADETIKKEQRPFRAWERLLKAKLKGSIPMQQSQNMGIIDVFQLGKNNGASDTAPQRIDFVTPEPHKPIHITDANEEKPAVFRFEASSIDITRNVNGLRNASTVTSADPHHTGDKPDSYRSLADAGLTFHEIHERDERQKQAKKRQN